MLRRREQLYQERLIFYTEIKLKVNKREKNGFNLKIKVSRELENGRTGIRQIVYE